MLTLFAARKTDSRLSYIYPKEIANYPLHRGKAGRVKSHSLLSGSEKFSAQRTTPRNKGPLTAAEKILSYHTHT